MVVPLLTALLFLNGLEVIDQGQDPSDHADFLVVLARFGLAKHLAPYRHVAGPMPPHLLTAIDDPIHLPERELALVLFAELRQIRGPHRHQVEGRHHAIPFASQSMTDGTGVPKLALARGG